MAQYRCDGDGIDATGFASLAGCRFPDSVFSRLFTDKYTDGFN